MICSRCGADSDHERMAKRRERGLPLLCPSCCAKPTKVVRTAYGKCRPWGGPFDERDNPLDETGRLYKPGERLCGMKDCVEPSHILSFESAWQQLVARIHSEQPAPKRRRRKRDTDGII